MLTYMMEDRGALSKTDFLVRSIKQDIYDFKLHADERMPSKRKLAEHLGISVITVERAYDILVSEDYLYAKDRSGFFVRDIEKVYPGTHSSPTPPPGLHRNINIPPDYKDSTTYRQLRRIMRRILSERPHYLITSPPNQGMPELRNALSSYLLRFRGMEAGPEQIVIGYGSEFLYNIIALMFGPEKTYAIEDPCYEKIRLIYESHHVKIQPLKMGPNGILSSELANCRADILHVSPFNSYPSNVTAPPAKRREYMKWAKENEAILIEDDFDSEYSYLHRPQQTMFTRNREGRVIYLNTFSKSLSPAAKIGYMVLPPDLVGLYREKAGFLSSPVPVFNQLATAELLDSGQFERHLARVRRGEEVFREN